MSERKFLDAALDRPEPGEKIEYFNNIKRRMNGYVLTENQKNQPQAGYCYEIDVTDMWEEYKKLKETCGYKLSFNTIIMMAMVEGLKAAPRLNAHINFDHLRCCGTLTIKSILTFQCLLCLIVAILSLLKSVIVKKKILKSFRKKLM
jgi:hypothetical protein